MADLPAPQQQRQIAPLDAVKQTLARNLKTVNALLAGYTTPERFMGGIVTAMQINPDLQQCSPQSVLLASLRVAQLRLSPDPALGQAYLIPRDGRAEFQLGYRGTLQLLYRSPLVRNVRYNVVRRGEHFIWQDGLTWKLEHQPGEEGWPTTWEELVAAWAIIELVNGGQIPRVMYAAEIRRHKERGRGKQPAWQTDLGAMAAKTVLGDAARRGPLDGESLLGVNLDHQGEAGLPQQTADLEEMVKGPEASQRAAEVILGRNQPRPLPEEPLRGEEPISLERVVPPVIDLPSQPAQRMEQPRDLTTTDPVLVEQLRRSIEAAGSPKPWAYILALNLPRVGDQIAQRLLAAGIDSYERIVEAGAGEISRKIAGVSDIGAQAIVLHAERQLHPEPEPPTQKQAPLIPEEVIPPAPRQQKPDDSRFAEEGASYERMAGPAAAPPSPQDGIPFPGQKPDPMMERARAGQPWGPPPPADFNKAPISKAEVFSLERQAIGTKHGGRQGEDGSAFARAALYAFVLETFGVPIDQLPKWAFRSAFRWAESEGADPNPPELAELREKGLAR